MKSKDTIAQLYYPALCGSLDGTFFITNTLYASEEEARKDLGGPFLRLVREYPPLKLETNKSLTSRRNTK